MSNTPKFTKDDWFIEKHEPLSNIKISTQEGNVICTTNSWHKENEANAKLIMNAPKMYALLKSLIDESDNLNVVGELKLSGDYDNIIELLNDIDN